MRYILAKFYIQIDKCAVVKNKQGKVSELRVDAKSTTLLHQLIKPLSDIVSDKTRIDTRYIQFSRPAVLLYDSSVELGVIELRIDSNLNVCLLTNIRNAFISIDANR